jgi:hypothetical protein
MDLSTFLTALADGVIVVLVGGLIYTVATGVVRDVSSHLNHPHYPNVRIIRAAMTSITQLKALRRELDSRLEPIVRDLQLSGWKLDRKDIQSIRYFSNSCFRRTCRS